MYISHYTYTYHYSIIFPYICHRFSILIKIFRSSRCDPRTWATAPDSPCQGAPVTCDQSPHPYALRTNTTRFAENIS